MADFEPLETVQHGPLHAWRLDWEAKLRAEGHDPAQDGAVASWIIQAPWAHPIWNSYWLHFVHLRPIDRGDGPIPTKFYREGATHEMWLYALNPDTKAETIARTVTPFEHCLTPKNFAEQLILSDDFSAAKLARETALDVLQGRLNPDTDAISSWWARFGDSMRKKGF